MSVLVLAAAQVCGACGASVEPIYVASGCPDQPLRGPEGYADEPMAQLIDDFESGDSYLTTSGVDGGAGGRNGKWILGWDHSSNKPIADVSVRCPARGKWAGHFAAGEFSSWGYN